MTVTHLIPVLQTAIGPMILISGIGLLLLTMTNRLGRAVDRSRVVEKLLLESTGEALAAAHEELVLLARRTQLIYTSITLAVLCALFICLLIAVAFLDAFVAANLAKVVGILFVMSMLALIGCLVVFLREIFLAVTSARRWMR